MAPEIGDWLTQLCIFLEVDLKKLLNLKFPIILTCQKVSDYPFTMLGCLMKEKERQPVVLFLHIHPWCKIGPLYHGTTYWDWYEKDKGNNVQE